MTIVYETSSPKDNDRSPEWSNLPQNLMQPFPHPNAATHKIWSRLTNWLQRYSSSKVWNFRHSRVSNSKMSGLIRPKIELDQAFMPVLVTSNFDDDLIKNGRASMETPFSHCKGSKLRSQWSNLAEIWTRPRFYACPRYLQYKKDRVKATEKRWRHPFPDYKSMGAFCCHGHQSYDPNCLKTLCSLSPPLVMLHIKFDQDWPTGLKRYSSSKV